MAGGYALPPPHHLNHGGIIRLRYVHRGNNSGKAVPMALLQNVASDVTPLEFEAIKGFVFGY